ncbi:MAG: hypothetical protein H0X33_10645 [Taibaiella sp.]|nr:hypothetical protein [Taibaiella sp.]
MSEWKDILAAKHHLPPGKLMAYLEGTLSPEEKHEVEVWIATNGMEADALEGLSTMSTQDAVAAVSGIDLHLHKHIVAKKRRSKAISVNNWAWVAVGVILALAVIAYAIICLLLKHKP